MSTPQSPDKIDSPGLLRAIDRLNWLRARGQLDTFPAEALAILSYPRSLFDYARRRYGGRRLRGLAGETILLRRTASPLLILSSFGVGAPVISVLVEELAALGLRQVVSLGMAAGIAPDLATGKLVLCSEAIRDEGTSYHYLPPSRSVFPDDTLTTRLAHGLVAARGPGWTLDAPYRATAAELAAHREAGVLTVDMEAAALFAVGQACGVRTAAIFAIADRYGESGWVPPVDLEAADFALRQALDIVIESEGLQ